MSVYRRAMYYNYSFTFFKVNAAFGRLYRPVLLADPFPIEAAGRGK